jgi:hypothetical protein
MRHDPEFTRRHPVVPLRDCSPHIQRMFGYTSKRAAAVTRDGRLSCSCPDRSNCTCRPTTDVAPTPAKPTISNAAALPAVMVLRHLDSRLAPLETRFGLSDNGGQGQASDLDQRFAEAEAKRVAMIKEAHISKVEKMVAQHEADKEPNNNLEPAEPAEQPGDDDDRAKYGAGRFDPSWKAAESALEAGRLLIEAKELVQHGEWEDWLAENVHFSERTARRYMQLFRSGLKPATVAVLGIRGAAELMAAKAEYEAANEQMRQGLEKLKALARDAGPEDWPGLYEIEAGLLRLEALDFVFVDTREGAEDFTEALATISHGMQVARAELH